MVSNLRICMYGDDEVYRSLEKGGENINSFGFFILENICNIFEKVLGS